MKILVSLLYLLENLIFAPNITNKIINKDIVVRKIYREGDLKFIKIEMDNKEISLSLPNEVISSFEWQQIINSLSKKIKINCEIFEEKLWNKKTTFTLIKINSTIDKALNNN